MKVAQPTLYTNLFITEYKLTFDGMQYFSWSNEVLPDPKPDSLLSFIKTILNFSRQVYSCYLEGYTRGLVSHFV